IRTDIRRRVDPFTDLCIRQGVTRVKEWSTSPSEYRASMYRLFSLGMKEHLAYGKKVTFASPEAGKIPDNAGEILTNGVRGGHDYAYNWLTFSGQNLDATIDLEEVKEVRRIESAYFQYGFWLRLFPVKVEYFVSEDGENFELVGSIQNTLPIDQYGGQQRDFIADFTPRKARYVRVVAHNLGNTPEWHPGAGRPANMSIDEIVVE
ncbi:MAG: discoidin domain-containing protein, partial [Cyclobacteriaceae bacterium]|nr:discoidin domain-containing protein [Cyclobacteriaceae bacterium]